MSDVVREPTGYETKHYELVIETGFWESPCKGYPVYKLVNKHNNQVEGEGIGLPSSILALINVTASYEEAKEIYRTTTESPLTGDIH